MRCNATTARESTEDKPETVPRNGHFQDWERKVETCPLHRHSMIYRGGKKFPVSIKVLKTDNKTDNWICPHRRADGSRNNERKEWMDVHQTEQVDCPLIEDHQSDIKEITWRQMSVRWRQWDVLYKLTLVRFCNVFIVRQHTEEEEKVLYAENCRTLCL